MKASELISLLDKLIKEHGDDLPIFSTCEWDFVNEVEIISSPSIAGGKIVIALTD